MDAAGNLFVAACSMEINNFILKVDSEGMLIKVAGMGSLGTTGDGGPALSANFFCPLGLEFDEAGNLYVADHGGNVVRRIDPSGQVSTVVGSGPADIFGGTYGGDGGPALEANLRRPHDLDFDSAGNLYIMDLGNNRVRRVDPEGTITTVAGNGGDGYTGDGGPATEAEFYTNLDYSQAMIAVGADGSLFVSVAAHSVVRRIDPQGIISTFAGTGAPGAPTEGAQAASSALTEPTGLAFDAEGNLYIADGALGTVYKVDPSGIITTFAGTGIEGYSGDGGPATAAQLHSPQELLVDKAGNVYIADRGNDLVRKVDQAGIMTTVAGGIWR
jgi:sugar lactone lactonase YvrE